MDLEEPQTRTDEYLVFLETWVPSGMVPSADRQRFIDQFGVALAAEVKLETQRLREQGDALAGLVEAAQAVILDAGEVLEMGIVAAESGERELLAEWVVTARAALGPKPA